MAGSLAVAGLPLDISAFAITSITVQYWRDFREIKRKGIMGFFLSFSS
jgi:hypothetical protein